MVEMPARQPLDQVEQRFEFRLGEHVVDADLGVWAADAVDAAVALDEADRVPGQVVVDDDAAVLEILALGQNVSADEDVDGLLGRRLHSAADWGELGEDLAPLRGVVAAVDAADGRAARRFEPSLVRLVREAPVEVAGRVLEGAEDQDFLPFNSPARSSLSRASLPSSAASCSVRSCNPLSSFDIVLDVVPELPQVVLVEIDRGQALDVRLGLGHGVEFLGHAAGGDVVLLVSGQEPHRLLKVPRGDHLARPAGSPGTSPRRSKPAAG